jgi:hypothetical protein
MIHLLNNKIIIINSGKLLAYTNSDEITPYERLLDDIFTDDRYMSLTRPFKKGLLRVETELKLLNIDLDEKKQKLVSNVWFEMKWFDTRLKWNPNDYEGIREITLPVDEIWVPDMVIFFFYQIFFSKKGLSLIKHFNLLLKYLSAL